MRDGADLVVEGYDFAPTFSIWTTIEECLNPPLIWERERGFYTTPPFSEPEVFEFPDGIGKVRVRQRRARGGRADPALGRLRARHVQVRPRRPSSSTFCSTLHKLGLDSTEPVSVRDVQVAPRDVVAAALPDPATLGERMTGRTCAGTWITGTGTDGKPRSTYLYHVVDNEHTMREYGSQAVVWQTAVNPVVALELIDEGTWKGAGVLGPEAFAPKPFLDRLAELGSPHGQQELAVDAAASSRRAARLALEVDLRRQRLRRRRIEDPRWRGFTLAGEELAEVGA